ncbi:MAG: hypothetical protein V2B18_13440 [Pseudomonadota bacterium]
MKKVLSVFIAMAALWYPSSSVFAQGMATFPINQSYGAYGERATGSGFLGTPRLYFGRLEHTNASVWSLQRRSGTGTAAWPLRGYWLGASTDLSLSAPLGLLVSGSVFLPQNSAATWYPEPVGTAYDFEVPSYDWWSADALAKYSVAGGLDVLAGLRWDHTSTRVSYFDNTDDDYILNAYIPLFGVQLSQRSSYGSLLIRAVGSPWVAGRLKYHFWTRTAYAEFGDFDANSGYYAELFADYSLKITGNVGLGGFLKWNALHLYTAEQNLSGSNTEPISWSVDIKSWTFGASLSVGL